MTTTTVHVRLSSALSDFTTGTSQLHIRPQASDGVQFDSVQNEDLLKKLGSLINKLQKIMKEIQHELLMESQATEIQKAGDTQGTVSGKLSENGQPTSITGKDIHDDNFIKQEVLSKPSCSADGLMSCEDGSSGQTLSTVTVPRYVDQSLVQIKVSNSEIQRRISAFIEQKRAEVDETNKREFCSLLYTGSDQTGGCARTDATVFPRVSGKSHIRVSRVINTQGPQTHVPPSPSKPPQSTKTDVGVEERLANMEKHLHLDALSEEKDNLYSRLKALEDRLLYLEGLSPEYFHHRPVSKKRHKARHNPERYSREQDMTIEEMDVRIQALQQTLKNKSQP